MENVEIKLQKALVELERIKKENQQLKELLDFYHIPFPSENLTSSYGAKEVEIRKRIRLFRSLFKGREDVYAVQRKREKGKIDYKPACKYIGNNTKNYFPLTDQVIYDHLSGEKIIGIYPVLKDDMCWFLAVDFDKKNWQVDVRAFMNTCKEYKVPANMERSRSGNGCHVWIFFETAIPARLARKLGQVLLLGAREKQAELHSFDRLFPNQDTVPTGKFGNLIALPLQKGPRLQNNSVFIDENFHPYPNQWNYLSQIKKINKERIEEIIDQLNKKEMGLVIAEQIPSTMRLPEKLPKKIEIAYKNGIYIPKNALPKEFITQVEELAKFNNPKFYQAQAKRFSTYNIPRSINCAVSNEHYLIIPRGCFGELNKLCKENKVELVVKDESTFGKSMNRDFLGQLTSQQEDAVQTLLQYNTGILSAATGFGKTVVAAALISRRKVNTLIIIHTKQLLEQWKERLASFLQLNEEDIGQLGGGKNTSKGIIDIATIQSLNYKGKVKSVIKNYGQIIVDECHHISAYSFERVLKEAEAKYVHGLTATPTRKDKLHPIMTMQCGPIRYKVSAKEQAKVRPFKHILIPRKTSFRSKLNEKEKNIQSMYAEIGKNTKRNEMIFNDVLLELENGSKPILLTERIEHVHVFERMFQGFAKNIIVLTGELNKKEREARLQQLKDIPDEKERLIIATGKYIGEGFDNAILDTLFLTMPISWKGTLGQYVGRLHRLHENKEVVKVYDYIDYQEDIFKNMYEKRKSGYKSLGYVIKGANSTEKESSEQMSLF